MFYTEKTQYHVWVFKDAFSCCKENLFLGLLKICIKAAFESEVDFQVNFLWWVIFFRKQQELKSSKQT